MLPFGATSRVNQPDKLYYLNFFWYIFFALVISYLNKQLNDLQLRPEKTTGNNSPWFSTPNEARNGPAPGIPLSTLRPSPLQLGQTHLDNRLHKCFIWGVVHETYQKLFVGRTTNLWIPNTSSPKHTEGSCAKTVNLVRSTLQKQTSLAPILPTRSNERNKFLRFLFLFNYRVIHV